jgi:hypothetical protein
MCHWFCFQLLFSTQSHGPHSDDTMRLDCEKVGKETNKQDGYADQQQAHEPIVGGGATNDGLRQFGG